MIVLTLLNKCLKHPQGIYDMNIEVSGIPLLSWEPPPLCEHIYVRLVLLTLKMANNIHDTQTFFCNKKQCHNVLPILNICSSEK